ncbi:helix-turn-helix domain-containing protein [Aquimarina sp. U1-2]|uniref:helix-turn-helix domain-containing protein n=1 Tax=Aquimarina sp. U1-2 TaxID=2823141 RepID=UPI001AEC8140|nr:helix-turn-helix domain-containing protein [Aquimarina sp. U1-2]MBP2833392.1 helix-turn-helix domain-containing protein [Aquimarina sp. U1-2]
MLVISSIFVFNTIYSQAGLLDSINKYKYNNPNKGKTFAYSLLKEGELRNNYQFIVTSLSSLGEIYDILSQKDSARYFFDEAIIKAYDSSNEDYVLFSKLSKASFLYNNYYLDLSLQIYNEALELATKLKYKQVQDNINIKIGRIKYAIDEYEVALKIFKDNYNNFSNQKYDISYSTDIYIAKCYEKLNKIDSALVYLQKGIEKSRKANDKEYEILFLNEFAIYYIHQKDLKKVDSVIDLAIQNSNELGVQKYNPTLLHTKARSRVSVGNYQESVKILTKIIEDNDKKIVPENLSKYYKLLAESYKEIDSVQKSNEYYQKYVIEENKKHNRKFNTLSDLHQLDLAKVNKKKDSYLQQRIYLTAIVCILLLLLLVFMLYQRKRNKVNQERFIVLMDKIKSYETKKKITDNSLNTNNNNEYIDNANNHQSYINEENLEKFINKTEPKVPEIDTSNDTQFIIKDEKINEILLKLKKLEEKQYFLKQDFTLHSAAKRLKTNTAYLSKIVNNELGKGFSTYVNELRINYALLELKNNSKLRAYSVNSIAQEMGYKSADSFTKYFKVATGLTPSVYIKKMNNFDKNNSSELV